MRCIVAEKPSVALDIARALGRGEKHEGYVTVGSDTITWAFGHLVTLAAPEAYDPAWKTWKWGSLPMLPEQFQLTAIAKSKPQLTVVSKLLRQADEVVCATDADREGELIFRYIVQFVGLRKPVQRLWLSENTATGILRAFQRLKPASAYDALAHAAESRAQADWLVGLNATRAFSLKHAVPGQPLSVGRVQTPTLRLIFDRDRTIEEFTPTPFWQLSVTFNAAEGRYEGVWQDTDREHPDRIPDAETAARLLARVNPGTPGVIESLEQKMVRLEAPHLFSLNDLQKEANRRYSLTAQQTLDAAQMLYDRHLVSYPRTDSRYVTAEIAGTLPERVRKLTALEDYRFAEEVLKKPLPLARVVNEAQVAQAGHYAIVPTGERPTGLAGREARVFDLIVRRFLAALAPAGQDERTTVITVVGSERFKTTGTAVATVGWRRVLMPVKVSDDTGEDKEEGDAAIPAGLRQGESVTVHQAAVAERSTKAPPKLTDASLLALMEKHGLGTPATRARIVEVLLQREYVERQKKALATTARGRQLLDLVPETIQSPELTGRWEARLEAIAAGAEDAAPFMDEIRQYTRELVDGARTQEAQPIASAALGICPVCGAGNIVATYRGWGCERSKAGCTFMIWREVAGKKLTPNQVKILLSGKTTAELRGFKSKSGKSFPARLRLNPETHRVEFVFSARSAGASAPRPKRRTAGKRGKPRRADA